jgi:hypothetical protein
MVERRSRRGHRRYERGEPGPVRRSQYHVNSQRGPGRFRPKVRRRRRRRPGGQSGRPYHPLRSQVCCSRTVRCPCGVECSSDAEPRGRSAGKLCAGETRTHQNGNRDDRSRGEHNLKTADTPHRQALNGHRGLLPLKWRLLPRHSRTPWSALQQRAFSPREGLRCWKTRIAPGHL